MRSIRFNAIHSRTHGLTSWRWSPACTIVQFSIRFYASSSTSARRRVASSQKRPRERSQIEFAEKVEGTQRLKALQRVYCYMYKLLIPHLIYSYRVFDCYSSGAKIFFSCMWTPGGTDYSLTLSIGKFSLRAITICVAVLHLVSVSD